VCEHTIGKGLGKGKNKHLLQVAISFVLLPIKIDTYGDDDEKKQRRKQV
jgi:hypothetical protein